MHHRSRFWVNPLPHFLFPPSSFPFPYPGPSPCLLLCLQLRGGRRQHMGRRGEKKRIKLASFTTFPLADPVKVRGGAADSERAALINFERP